MFGVTIWSVQLIAMFSAVGNHTNVIGKTLDGNDLTHKDLEKFDAILEMLLVSCYHVQECAADTQLQGCGILSGADH